MNQPARIFKSKYAIILIIIGIFFIAVYSWLYYGNNGKFTSPDETANYFFTRLFAERSELSYNEQLNEVAQGLIRPRSTAYINGHVIPGSFFGMIIIYGLIGKVFGQQTLLFYTPILASLSVVFYYLLIKKIFFEKIAFFSSLLLFLLPPFWYYSSRGMFNNIPYLSLLIIGLYFLITSITGGTKVKTFLLSTIGGFLIGLSVFIRTSEVVWIVLILFSLLILYRKKINKYTIIGFTISFGSILFLIFNINNHIFGSPFSFTYSQEETHLSSLTTTSHVLLIKLKKLLFPFGIDFAEAGQVAYNYLLSMFSWFSIFLLVGLLWYIKNIFLSLVTRLFISLKINVATIERSQAVYSILYCLLIIWLILYYGSFTFSEYLDKTQIILGSSYIRYWLPLYIFGLPFFVFSIGLFIKKFNYLIIKKFLTALIIIVYCSISIRTVLLDPLQGLHQLKNDINYSNQVKQIVGNIITEDAVIISGYADKVFFPDWPVIVRLPLDNENSIKILNQLLTTAPIYYLDNPLDITSQKQMITIRLKHYTFREVYKFPATDEVLYQLQ